MCRGQVVEDRVTLEGVLALVIVWMNPAAQGEGVLDVLLNQLEILIGRFQALGQGQQGHAHSGARGDGIHRGGTAITKAGEVDLVRYLWQGSLICSLASLFEYPATHLVVFDRIPCSPICAGVAEMKCASTCGPRLHQIKQFLHALIRRREIFAVGQIDIEVSLTHGLLDRLKEGAII